MRFQSFTPFFPSFLARNAEKAIDAFASLLFHFSHIERLFLVLLTAIAISGCVSTSSDKPAFVPEAKYLADGYALPVDPNLESGQLENGLSYFIYENSTPSNFAEFRLVVKAGSIQEDEAQLGFAHFVEHMAFNGTEDFSKEEIISFVESIGMRFGAHLNAYTSFDQTVYTLTVPTTNPNNIDIALKILENWAHKISFDELEVDAERGVILEEMRSRKGVFQRISDQTVPLFYAGTTYPERLPIGKEHILTSGSIEDLTRYYKTWYRPELMAVVVTGDVYVPAVKRRIFELFSPLQNASNTIHEKQSLSDVDDVKVLSIVDEELTNSALRVSYRIQRDDPIDKENYRQSIIDGLANNALSARLNQIVWEESAPYKSFNLGASWIVGEYYLDFVFVPKPGRSKETLELFFNELNRVKQRGFDTAEFEKQTSLTMERLNRRAKNTANYNNGAYANMLVGHFLNRSALMSDQQVLELVEPMINDIDIQMINQSLVERVSGKPIVVQTRPTEDLQQRLNQDSVIAMLSESESRTFDSFATLETASEILSSLPTPGSIESKEYDSEHDTHLWTLSNGAKVILKQTSLLQGQLVLEAKGLGGFSKVDDATYLETYGMMSAIPMLGLGELDAQELNQFLREKRYWVSPRIGLYTETMSGSSNVEDVEAFLQLLHARFTQPVSDQGSFDWMKRLQAQDLEKRWNTPMAAFYREIEKAIDVGNPRNVEYDLQQLAKQDLTATFNVYQRAFANAQDFEFVIVGDFSLTSIEPLVETYIASLPKGETEDKIEPLPRYFYRGHTTVEVKAENEPKATVLRTRFDDFEWSHENQLAFSALRYSLENRLRVRLREELSGVYGVSFFHSLYRWPYQSHYFSVQFVCDPNRVEELKNEVELILLEYQNNAVTQEDLDNFKISQRTSRKRNLENINYLANYYMQLRSEYNKALTTREFYDALDALTLEQVNNIARGILSSENGYDAVLLPK